MRRGDPVGALLPVVVPLLHAFPAPPIGRHGPEEHHEAAGPTTPSFKCDGAFSGQSRSPWKDRGPCVSRPVCFATRVYPDPPVGTIGVRHVICPLLARLARPTVTTSVSDGSLAR